MLNEQQLALVHAPKGKILCIAGAGSGKTHCIIEKIKYAIKYQDIKPYEILAITFTKKAAIEMQERAEKAIGKKSELLTICTINSFCYRHVIVPYPKYFGYSTNKRPMILTEGYKTILKAMYPKVSSRYLNSVAHTIDYHLTRCKPIPPNDVVSIDNKDINLETLFKQMRQFQFENQVITFTDQIVFAYQRLEEDFEFRKELGSKYKLVIVDEAQDNNLMQNKILLHLSAVHNNVIAVGDDAQSIYGFRGADPYFFTNLHKKDDFKLYTLTTNYRSYQYILDLGNSILKPNFEDNVQIKKMLKAHRETNTQEKPNLYVFDNQMAEADYIISQVKGYAKIAHPMFKEYRGIAILCRSVLGGIGRSLQASFRNAGIPYHVVGGGDIANSKHIGRMFSAFALACGYVFKDDWVNLLMIFPGIGDVKGRRIADSIEDLTKVKIPEPIRIGIDGLKKLITKLATTTKKPSDCFNLFRSWYLDTLITHFPNVEREELQHVDYILNIVGSALEGKDLELAIENIKMDESKNEDEKDNDENSVVISTIHRSKGLEWPFVIIPDCHDEMIPHKRAESISEIQEECRIFHVAVTRAKDKLLLTATDEGQGISRFIDIDFVQCRVMR